MRAISVRQPYRGGIVGRFRLAGVVFTLNSGHRSADTRLRNGQACVLCGGDYSAGSCPASDPWAIPGAVGLLLADVEPLPFVPCNGALGFFEVPYRGPVEDPELEAIHGAAVARGELPR